MCVPAWVHVHHMCVGAGRGQKMSLAPLELEFTSSCELPNVERLRTQVRCHSSACSDL